MSFSPEQISGVEGYTESIAMGMLAGIHVARIAQGLPAILPPRETALEARWAHLHLPR